MQASGEGFWPPSRLIIRMCTCEIDVKKKKKKSSQLSTYVQSICPLHGRYSTYPMSGISSPSFNTHVYNLGARSHSYRKRLMLPKHVQGDSGRRVRKIYNYV